MIICFCTPYGPYVDVPEHQRRKVLAQGQMLEHQFTYAEMDMNVVSLARNTIAASVPETVDVTWWVDSDVLLPPNAAELLSYVSDEHPVVSGLYFSRRFPYLPQAYTRAFHHEDGKHPYLPLVDIPNGPTKVDAVGAGFMIVRRDVFDKLQEAHDDRVAALVEWQDDAVKWQDDLELYGVTEAIHYYRSLSPWFEFLGKVGEDFYFCERLAQIGIRPLLVPHVVADHVGYVPIGLAHFQQMRAASIHYTHDKLGGHSG